MQRFGTDRASSREPPSVPFDRLDPSSPPSGGAGPGSHDPEERVDVVALDGIAAGGDHLVLGLTH